MTNSKRDADRPASLSQLEVAALTSEVLERARRALRESPEGPCQAVVGEPAAQTKRASRPAGPSFGAKLAGRVRKDFEFFTIACCVIVTGGAWIIQSAGANA